MVVVAVSEFAVPVIVRVTDPSVALLAAVKVNVQLVEVDVGLNVPVTPLGRPVIVRSTDPEKPFAGTTLIATVLWPVRCTLRLVGDANKVKLAGGGVVFEDELLQEIQIAKKAEHNRSPAARTIAVREGMRIAAF